MAINFSGAVSAYQRIARQDTIPAPGASDRKAGGDFAEALRNATEGAVATLREGEQQTINAALGTADLTVVVTGVG